MLNGKSLIGVALPNGISANEINCFWYCGTSDEIIAGVTNWEALHSECF